MSAEVVLAMMLKAEPAAAVSPWRSTYEASAETIAKVAEDSPLFSGSEGVEQTEALLVSLGWFEGRLRQDAQGDCHDAKGKAIPSVNGVCPKGSTPASVCMFQINRSNFSALRTTEEELQTDFEKCTRAAVTMIRISFSVCRGRSDDEKLGHYASGGEKCAGLVESRHRIAKAKWIAKSVRVGRVTAAK